MIGKKVKIDYKGSLIIVEIMDKIFVQTKDVQPVTGYLVKMADDVLLVIKANELFKIVQ